jgi:hypothetical protein
MGRVEQAGRWCIEIDSLTPHSREDVKVYT